MTISSLWQTMSAIVSKMQRIKIINAAIDDHDVANDDDDNDEVIHCYCPAVIVVGAMTLCDCDCEDALDSRGEMMERSIDAASVHVPKQ